MHDREYWAKLNFNLPSSITSNLFNINDLQPCYYVDDEQLEEGSKVGKLTETFKEKIDDKEFGFIMYAVKDRKNIRQFMSLLPPVFSLIETPRITWQKINAHNQVNPHIDPDRGCVINAYVKVNEEKTCFFKKKDLNQPSLHKKIELYLIDDTEVVTSFCAKQGELFLLNTSKLHGVTSCNVNKDRLMITFTFKKSSYQEIYEFLVDKQLVDNLQ